MTYQWKAADEAFFAERKSRAPGAHRSLARGRAVATQMGALPLHIPVVSVVGSKGKGTTAIYASAILSLAGLKVVTITSPALVANNERIRVNGRAIDDATFGMLAARVTAACAVTPKSDANYLSPSGAFTIAGVAFAHDVGADVVVCEEGLGGASDEVSLFAPLAVALTPVFLEHVGIIGDTLQEIAADLLGVVTPDTRAIVSGLQSGIVEKVLSQVADYNSASIVRPRQSLASFIKPHGLISANALLGVTLGCMAAELLGREVVDTQLPNVLSSVFLPGRLSSHHSPVGSTWVVDSPISPEGVRVALKHFRDTVGVPDVMFACFPDTKDVAACFRELVNETVCSVTVGLPYLRFDSPGQPMPPRPFVDAVADIDREQLLVLAVGTISFVGEVLGYLQVDCTTAY